MYNGDIGTGNRDFFEYNSITMRALARENCSSHIFS